MLGFFWSQSRELSFVHRAEIFGIGDRSVPNGKISFCSFCSFHLPSSKEDTPRRRLRYLRRSCWGHQKLIWIRLINMWMTLTVPSKLLLFDRHDHERAKGAATLYCSHNILQSDVVDTTLISTTSNRSPQPFWRATGLGFVVQLSLLFHAHLEEYLAPLFFQHYISCMYIYINSFPQCSM